jgi:hypothetical protein
MDCHRTAFGDEFSPTQGIFNSKSYRKLCKALYFTGVLENESPLLKTMVDRLEQALLIAQ